jgi:hypothetical protein
MLGVEEVQSLSLLFFLCVLCVWSGSLKKDVGKLKGCDSEALLQAVRCLGKLRGCDRFLFSSFFVFFASSWFVKKGCWEVGGSAIAKRCCKQFAVWELRECDRSLVEKVNFVQIAKNRQIIYNLM